MNALHQSKPSVTPLVPANVARANAVAPLTPSADVWAAIQTASPDNSAG